METTGPRQEALVAAPLAGFVAHVSWRPGEGWRVWCSSWVEGQTPPKGRQDQYTALTADEALDVLTASMYSRCEWLRADDR